VFAVFGNACTAERYGSVSARLQGPPAYSSVRNLGRREFHAESLSATTSGLDGGVGWLGDDVWLAHAVHVDDEEVVKFAKAGVGVAHCPCSNMRLASGIAPIKKYIAAGVKVGIGVDGSASNDSSNMMGEARQALLLARLKMGLLPPEGSSKYRLLSQSHPLRASEWMTAREVIEIGTRGGAAVLGRLDDLGSLEVGKCADFFSIDLHTVDYEVLCTIQWPRLSSVARKSASIPL
jgi:cytosine/adenosine deaminase-related metal-dependent hydrolase